MRYPCSNWFKGFHDVRGCHQRSEVASVEQNQKLGHTRGFRLSGPLRKMPIFSSRGEKSRFWGPDSKIRGFCSACSEGCTKNLKAHLWANFRLYFTSAVSDFLGPSRNITLKLLYSALWVIDPFLGPLGSFTKGWSNGGHIRKSGPIALKPTKWIFRGFSQTSIWVTFW